MLTYSIVIRTLGTGGEKFREELVSICGQTILPERVLVYIAEGYSRPAFTVGREEYVWVKKGMMAQRILPYDDISSDCILMLDDDVRLAPDSAERMLRTMVEYDADCVGADTFNNHEMTWESKMYAAITNFVIPHYSRKWAFKIHRNGSFSYNNCPTKSFYWSQSCAGPASLWKKFVYKQLHLEDELWLEEFDFTYGEDMLEFYKIYKNGFRLGILYDSGIEHLDAGSSSGAYRRSPQRMYIRSKVSFILWWRTCYRPGEVSLGDRALAVGAFAFKSMWQFGIMCVAAVMPGRHQVLGLYLKGIRDGWRFVHSQRYASLGAYVIAG